MRKNDEEKVSYIKENNYGGVNEKMEYWSNGVMEKWRNGGMEYNS